MELSLLLILGFMLLGIIAGFLAGLLGIGGGGMMVPILTSIFLYKGVPVSQAVPMALGTAMSSIIIISFASSRAHWKNKNISIKAFTPMALGVVLGVACGTFIVSISNSLFLSLFFCCFMTYISITLFLDKKPKPTRKLLPPPYLFFGGGIIGTVSALVSIGGGSLTVPFLIWQNIEGKKAFGTSAAIGFPLSVVGAICYMIIGGKSSIDMQTLTFGYVYLPAVFFISTTSFIAATIGAKFTHKLPISVLKKILGTLNMLLAIKMLTSVLGEF